MGEVTWLRKRGWQVSGGSSLGAGLRVTSGSPSPPAPEKTTPNRSAGCWGPLGASQVLPAFCLLAELSLLAPLPPRVPSKIPSSPYLEDWAENTSLVTDPSKSRCRLLTDCCLPLMLAACLIRTLPDRLAHLPDEQGTLIVCVFTFLTIQTVIKVHSVWDKGLVILRILPLKHPGKMDKFILSVKNTYICISRKMSGV